MASTVTQIGLSSSANNTLASSLMVSGLASGMNWQATVQALAGAERAPETQWQAQQTTLDKQNAVFTTIKQDLTSLQTDLKALQDPSLFSSRTAQTSDSTIASATAASGATLGTFSFNISQLATAAQINGQSGISTVLSPDGNLNNVTLGTAGFASAITAGTFTVNGAQVTIATTDSLQQVFDKISTATNGEVTAAYDSGADAITLTDAQGNQIVLGSATDTSNFLQATGLYNNNSPSVTSLAALGHVQLTGAMADADLKTAVTDGGSGQGAFTINGVTINFNASSDSIQNVLDRINSSGAGVTASYDAQNNRFTLTNQGTGDIGIAMQDVSGNFLAATGLSGGTLARGLNLLYKLNGGTQQLVSQSNTIETGSSNLTGLSVTAQKTGVVTVSVSSDTSTISSAVQKFVADYNAVQSYITSQMAVTNNPDGTVTAGLLTGDMTANGIASNLRTLGFSAVATPGSTNAISSLAALGLTTNGQNNTVTVDSSKLNAVLATNLSAVQSFFANTSGGFASQLNNYLDGAIGDTGTLTMHQTTLSNQSSDITTQIKNLEAKITTDSNRWTTEFQAMEQAQAQVNQELTYLSEQVSNGSL